MMDCQGLASHRAYDNKDKGDKKEVDTQTLAVGFSPGNGRSEAQTGRQPGRCNPQDAELNVPGPGQRVRQPVGQRDTVEAGSFDSVMGRDNAHQHLDNKQRSNDPEVLPGCIH